MTTNGAKISPSSCCRLPVKLGAIPAASAPPLSPTARKFEAGTPAIPNIYGAIKGIELLQEIGLDEVAAHIAHLTAEFMRGARNLGVQIKTPPDSVGPLTVVKCRDSEALVAKLAAKGIVVSNRKDGLRVSFHVYNTTEDVEAVLDALKANLDLLAVGQTTTSDV